ncbi:unnamed protein product, partial [Rotaria sp. Silwood2]
MYKKFYFISIIQLFLFQISISIHIGHEVGSTSMDSTHYDRQLLHQQCPLNSETKDIYRTSFWAAIRSSSLTTNTSNQSSLIPFRRQLIINNGEDRLITRASSNTGNVNNNNNTTTQLGIDQAAVDIIVDNQ